jgi:16S rRNA (cytosine1402-N4)-methyltransferase
MKDERTGAGAHVPVLLRECIDGLNIRPGGIYVDGTLGRAGHALEIVRRLDQGKLVGIDRDETAINEAGALLKEYDDRIILVRGNFKDIGALLDGLGIPKVDGMLFDLGVSSPQLDEAARGFSYMTDAPLDMRMDRQADLSAYDIVNEWAAADLRRILWEYGEERYAGQIASKIIKKRAVKPIETTLELTGIIREAMPAKALREKQHPAKRTFQAIRIAVNDELGAVREMLETAPDRLRAGGRLCIISFHSLEDRLVKNAITKRENGCTCPRDFPVCVCGFKPTLKAVTKKPVIPTDQENEQNPRARSAKLRVAERLN